MASKFSEFLKEHKIDERRVMSSSRQLERLRREDRLARVSAKKKSGDDKPKEGDDAEAAAPTKPRSGRPVTPRLLAAAHSGGKISGPAKTRLLRAVNRVLEQKKQEPVDLRALF